MHIPDGYLSPQTCAAGFVLAVPMWAVASQRIKKRVRTRQVPTLAVLAAVCFLVMMFNVPIPDGTTAHAVGGSLVAIILGPWAALIAVSVALLFQALLFGDGGVLAFGFNVFNMGVVLPFVGYGIYRLVAGRSRLTSPRRVLGAALGGYIGINVAALCVGLELGAQPLLFHTAAGTPLYSPYHFAQAVPAMLFAHLTVAGFAEAVLAAGVVAYLQRANLPLLRVNHPDLEVTADEEQTRTPRRVRPGLAAGIAVLVMVVATPLGLLAPGGAFGEDAPGDLPLHQLGLSAVPQGLANYSDFWNHAIFGGYAVHGTGDVTGYLISAVVGIAVVGVVVFGLAWLIRALTNRGTTRPSRGASLAAEIAAGGRSEGDGTS